MTNLSGSEPSGTFSARRLNLAAGFSDSADVVIVGGGPAGLSAGIALAQAGISVIVIERRTYPVDKVCGEGIMPSGVALLRRLQIDAHLESGSFYPFRGIRYNSATGRTAEGDFAEGVGWGVRRLTLSGALHARAKQEPTLRVIEGTRAIGVHRGGDTMIVRLEGEADLSARLVIGADGLHSQVRRWAGLQRESVSGRRWGIRRHFQTAPWSDYVEVYWATGVEAYVTPCSADSVEIAFLWDENRYPAVAKFETFLTLFPAVKARIGTGEPLDAVQGAGPLRQVTAVPIADGIALIGDAAGYLDAITGEGISLALAQADALCETIVEPLGRLKVVLSGRELAPYARAYTRIVRPYYVMTQATLVLSRFPWLADRLIHSLGTQPEIFQRLLSFNMGRTPGAGELLTTLGRLMWGIR